MSDVIKSVQIDLNLFKSAQIHSNRFKSDQIGSNPYKSGQITSNHIKSMQIHSNRIKSGMSGHVRVTLCHFRACPGIRLTFCAKSNKKCHVQYVS